MAFPPNYRQERSNRERAKQRKALEKQQKRAEKSGQRQDGLPDGLPPEGNADETQNAAPLKTED